MLWETNIKALKNYNKHVTWGLKTGNKNNSVSDLLDNSFFYILINFLSMFCFILFWNYLYGINILNAFL